ncbi:MAG: insulinase family protein [Planctomycetes bacterium]|nr:insulinase family protein [Planctomycetota bacterium]MBI3847922.1 insulinase family protein [Planctomycetota bacterium]
MKFEPVGNFVRADLGRGVDLFVRRTDKFKTITLKAFLRSSLREDVTSNALLPSVLKRGTESHPTFRDVTRHLENLYGASYSADVLKIGEEHVLSFRIEVLADAFVSKRRGLFPHAAAFLAEMLFRPALDRGDRFPADVVEQEKLNLRRLIESLINNKISYASERLIQEMCKGEPFARYEYGDVADLDAIDGESLRRHHRQMMSRAPLHLFVVGDVDPRSVAETLAEALPLAERSRDTRIPPPPIQRPAARVRMVVEEEEVTQGKLAIGYRTEVMPTDDRFVALAFASAIFGGGPFSKLFKNVREKASLAYYAHSALEKCKGILLVQCGIESANFDKALRIIKRQLKDIVDGKFGDEEFSATRRALVTRMQAVEDSPAQLVNATLEGLVSGRVRPTDRVIRDIRRVRPGDVVDAARTIRLDTVYFLRAKTTAVAATPSGAAAGAAFAGRIPSDPRKRNA